MSKESFTRRLDQLAQRALLTGMEQTIVDDMYFGMLDNFENEFPETEDQLAMLEGNVNLILERDDLELAVAA